MDRKVLWINLKCCTSWRYNYHHICNWSFRFGEFLLFPYMWSTKLLWNLWWYIFSHGVRKSHLWLSSRIKLWSLYEILIRKDIVCCLSTLILFCLFESRMTKREKKKRKRDRSSVYWVHSPNGPNSWGWPRPKLRARDSIWVFPVAERNWNTWAIIHCFKVH